MEKNKLSISFYKDKKKTKISLEKAWKSFENILPEFLGVIMLVGVLDAEVISKIIGSNSGWFGVIAAVFMRKGVKFTNILIFIGSWSTTKIPMFIFEISSLGKSFAITRLLIDIPAIIIIAYILAVFVSKDEIKGIYKNAEKL